MTINQTFDFGEELRRAASEIRETQAVGAHAILAEEPVPLTVFVQDRKYLANPPLSDIQYEAVRHIERIYYQDTYKLLVDEFESGKREGRLHIAASNAVWREEKYWSTPIRMCNFVTMQWGKGAGKDHICRVASMRIAYMLLCLNSPQKYFGMPEQDTIHLLNVASNSAQAQQAFFMPVVRAVKKGWFVDKCVPRQNLISYAKNIESISGHSDAESQEGLNLLLGIADEIDAFKSKKELTWRKNATSREPTKSAEGILNMMRSSSATRFPETFKNVRISYPRYLGSVIQQLTAQARDDNKERKEKSRHYVSGPLATWEVNPRVTGRETFAEDYREDPVMARAKYECRPDRAINPYFRNVAAVDSAFVLVDKEPLMISYKIETSTRSNRRVWVPVYGFSDKLYPIRGANYTIHADLAVSGDRAGICMAHVAEYEEHDSITEDADGAAYTVRETRPKVKVDFCVGFTADQSVDPPREIQIRWARQLCFELIKRGFNIVKFSFDAFQCLSGDTKIPLLDGTTRTLRELDGAEPFWVYSIKDGRVVPGLCTRAWKTGHRDDMLEIELDNGEKIRATSDHRLMLRDGTYSRADRLKAGDSLMPLYRRLRKVSPTSAEYEQIWHPEPDGSGKRWRFTHSMVSHYTHGPVPKGSLTHHVNVNERDNRPENLRQMTFSAHSELHRAMADNKFSTLWADPEWREVHRKRISAAQTAAQAGKIGTQSRRYRKEVTFELIAETHRAILLDGVIPTRALIQERLGITQGPLYDRIRGAGFRSWKAYRDHIEGVSRWNAYQRQWRRRRKETDARNHKVVAIRPAPSEDVYDLTVEEHHNFATDAGVFVHNSVDSMQILEERGIDTERISTNTSEEPWRTLRDLVYEGRIDIPRLSIENMAAAKTTFLLRDEMLALSRMPNGKIDHPSDGCFVGETRIPLLDGTAPEIRDLAGKEVWVYSAKPDGSIVPGKARGRHTKDVTELVDIILDNGYVARCTPDHRWMLRDGSYKPAAELIPGVDRLMPINRVWPVNGGYECVTDAHGRRTTTHQLVAEHFAGRTVLPHEVVHHLNHIKTDNSPANVAIIDAEHHRRHHANERWARDPEYVAKMRGRNVIIARLREHGYTSWKEFQSACDANHKVRHVVPVTLTEPVPVYDLEVEEWDNFALTGGVFVHNSKDLADALAIATLTAIQVGGREEGPEARRYYEPDTFSTGGRVELPFGVSTKRLSDIWTSSLTSF